MQSNLLVRNWNGDRGGPSHTRLKKAIRTQPFPLDKKLPPFQWSESTGECTIMVPVAGVDLRQIFILATPDTLLIEFRDRETLKQEGYSPVFSETRDRRVSRELRLRHPIEKGICLQIYGSEMRITCRKARTQEEPWSELLYYNTRASLGCV
ncbi:MAG: hypothetical protein JO182_12840 [Acidobacteriaceae bacterium]|nr:hypothetical protein [Acidobacteriaceae bacterium]MBV9679503.1 hypothetical protein [Acidobacteriaceae bacterium]